MLAKIQINFEGNRLCVVGQLHPSGLDVSGYWDEQPSCLEERLWDAWKPTILGDMTKRLFLARAAQFN